MRTRALFVVAALGLSAPSAWAQSQVQVFASVVDGGGAVPETLQRDDLRILEGGTALTVARIEPVRGWPTKLQVLVDNGAGLGGDNLIHLRNGVRNLLSSLSPGIEVTLISLAPQPRMIVRSTSDRAAYMKGPDLLTPDTGAGKFVDGLKEALQRIERDKSDHFPMIVMLGTAAGDNNFRDSDIAQIQKLVAARPVTIHAAVITMPGRTASQGAVQGELGIWTTKVTGGRFETIAAVSRVSTLLEEIGVAVAESHKKQTNQFRVTVERASASQPVGGVSAAARGGLTLTGLSFDGRHP